MKRSGEVTIPMRIVIESPVVAVRHSLQTKDGRPFDAKESASGEALSFDFPVRLAPGPKFFGDQVRREWRHHRDTGGRDGQGWHARLRDDAADRSAARLATGPDPWRPLSVRPLAARARHASLLISDQRPCSRSSPQ